MFSVAFALFSLACTPVPPCQQSLEVTGSEQTAIISIADPATDEEVVSQLFAPLGLGRYASGAPVVVYVHGAWTTNFVPVTESISHLNPTLGVVQLYLNLPGGRSDPDHDSPGENDRRGAASRAAVATALQYADEAIADSEGCTLSERIGGPLSGQIAVAGYSNGGNLAWATLGDAELDLPEIVGISTYETPLSGQLVVVESGTTENDSPVYIEDACALQDNALICDYDYTGIAYDDSAEDGGVLFIDADNDSTYDVGEFRLGAVQYAGRWNHSVQARRAARDAGLILSNRASVKETEAFWQEREAPRSMVSAIQRFPDLAAISTGSEIDHVLTGAVEHPHVTGMITAMQAAGIRWSRLHPDSAYSTMISRSSQDFPENDANRLIAVGERLPMLPTGAAAHGEDYLTAAIIELLDRAHYDQWSNNIDAVLAR